MTSSLVRRLDIDITGEQEKIKKGKDKKDEEGEKGKEGKPR